VDTSLTHINRLAVVMWMLTYIGAVFNGITILILADILLFAAPPLYKIADYTLLGPKTCNDATASQQQQSFRATTKYKKS
uniref:Reticulon n=1 Tax=Poecilia reticulata TaxID=8081 RepID=A0A3P9PI01_POERE